MKHLATVLLFTLLTLAIHAQDKDSLFVIRKGTLWGYCNSEGEVVIKPKYRNAEEFSEGLAAVRLNGTYGYINKEGDYVIKPAYDAASDFQNGLSQVYVDGKPLIIDKRGEVMFEHNYKYINPMFDYAYAEVKTTSGKYGLIRCNSGALLVDTILSARVEVFNYGSALAIVKGIGHKPYPNDEEDTPTYKIGIVDTTGQFIVPFGKYSYIRDWGEGYFSASELLPENTDHHSDSEKTVILDGDGKVVLSKYLTGDFWISSNISNGMMQVTLSKYKSGDNRATGSSDDDYTAYMNMSGEIVINDTNYVRGDNFIVNRAFVSLNSWDKLLIDRSGKIVIDDTFSCGNVEVLPSGYIIACTKPPIYRGVMDTNGHYLVQPRFDEIKPIGQDGQFFLFTQSDDDDDEGPWGIVTIDDHIILKPKINEAEFSGFRNGLLKCLIKDRLAYVNTDGEIVWKEKKSRSKHHQQLNIDYMNRGYYYAGSPYREDLAGYGGWGRSDNMPKDIDVAPVKYNDSFSIFIDTNNRASWAGKFEGCKLYVINTTKDTFYFSAQDSRLYMNLQAQNKAGEWKDIEYIPSSWCGNSYHSVYLSPGKLWEFAIPKYHGTQKTKVRAKLLYRSTADGEEYTLYSNEVNASVNPGQYWHKKDYYRHGLMDPYND